MFPNYATSSTRGSNVHKTFIPSSAVAPSLWSAPASPAHHYLIFRPAETFGVVRALGRAVRSTQVSAYTAHYRGLTRLLGRIYSAYGLSSILSAVSLIAVLAVYDFGWRPGSQSCFTTTAIEFDDGPLGATTLVLGLEDNTETAPSYDADPGPSLLLVRGPKPYRHC